MFYDEWLEKVTAAEGLLSNGITAEELVVSKGNIAQLLKSLDIEEVVKAGDGVHMLDFYENG